ncbi:MAG: hypothetical protein V7785_21010 [Bermanella sp.]
MTRIFISIFLILNITACGSDSDSNSEIDLSGSWKRDNMPFSQWRANHTWTFSSDGTFTIDNIIYAEGAEATDGTVTPAFEGTFSIGSSIDMPSGQTAIELNLIYNTPRNSAYGFEEEPADSVYTEYGSEDEAVSEIVYIQDDNLYFGIRDTLTTEGCSDLYLLPAGTLQDEYLTEYDDDLLGRSNCYIRPTELDFDNMLYKVE